MRSRLSVARRRSCRAVLPFLPESVPRSQMGGLSLTTRDLRASLCNFCTEEMAVRTRASSSDKRVWMVNTFVRPDSAIFRVSSMESAMLWARCTIRRGRIGLFGRQKRRLPDFFQLIQAGDFLVQVGGALSQFSSRCRKIVAKFLPGHR